jgi:hypothetical protein
MLTKWYPSLIELDSKGPFQWAASRGLPEFPWGLVGAVDGPVKSLFEDYEGDNCIISGGIAGDADDDIVGILYIIAHRHVEYTMQLQRSYRICMGSELVEIAGVKGIIIESTEVEATQQFRDKLAEEGKVLGFCVSRDERGDGWALYRFNDDPRIDFSKHIVQPEGADAAVANATERPVEYIDGVVFAHPNGFISKTTNVSRERALQLVELAIA